jgi:Zn-dependent metalloprotease
MKKCNCFCSIIPPVMVDNLKKNGVDIGKGTINADKNFRLRRILKQQSLEMQGVVQPLVGNANRNIFDCQHTTNRQLALMRNEGSVAVADASVNNAYDFSGKVREFFKTVLGWNSIDNNGLDMILNVHYSNKYNNAFWDGTQMTFGDGDGVIFKDFTNSLDVTGHEMSHGVVQYTANLTYNKQSGALNEHYADALGIAVKQFALGQTALTSDWLIGADIMGPQLQGMAIRSMKSPGTAYNSPLLGKDPQPDNMSKIYTGAADNGGVHINSGIPNKVFYLVAIGIGTMETAKLWFETLKVLKPTTNFNSFRTAIKKMTKKMVMAGKLPATTTGIVDNAFTTVGL